MSLELEGVSYQILAPDLIVDYVKKVADKEWSAQDFVQYGAELLSQTWVLKQVAVSDIKVNGELLQTEKFQEDLAPRIKNVRQALESHTSIPPLILRGSDFLIFDGYARYHVFKERNVAICFAYVN
jgi:hypothetical protein